MFLQTKMEFNFGVLFLLALIKQVCALQVPLTESSQRFFSSSNSTAVLISANTDRYIKTLLEKWGSTGLSVAAVRKDDTAPNGWKHGFGSYGMANADGSLITSDSVFAASPRTANYSSRCRLASWFPTKLWQRNAGKRSNGQQKYAT